MSKEESESGEEVERSRATDPILKALLGADTESGLSLLDPISRSHYHWVAYRNDYFARVTRYITAIIDRDPKKSGLYRSRLCTKSDEQSGIEPEHRWIAKEYLPLRQQVALVHEHTKAIACKGGVQRQRCLMVERASHAKANCSITTFAAKTGSSIHSQELE